MPIAYQPACTAAYCLPACRYTRRGREGTAVYCQLNALMMNQKIVRNEWASLTKKFPPVSD